MARIMARLAIIVYALFSVSTAAFAGTGYTQNNLVSFNIANIGGKLYVSYALQDGAKHDDLAGAGHGFINIFNADGTLVGRFASAGALNSPWGMTVAPANFGQFSNDLLVGNFGDRTIHAFNPNTKALVGTLGPAKRAS